MLKGPLPLGLPESAGKGADETKCRILGRFRRLI